MARSTKNSVRGITLLELVLAISLVFFFSCLVFRNYQSLWTSSTLTRLTLVLTQAIHFTQSMALTHATRVTVCASEHPPKCEGPWSNGYIVKTQRTLLRRYPKLPHGYTLKWHGNFNQNTALTFTAEGFTYGQQGSFTMCAPHASQVIRIVVSRGGRLRFLKEKGYASCAITNF